VSRSLVVENGARRRGRDGQYVDSACYVWRISAVVQGLHRLLDSEAAAARTAEDVHKLTVLEHRVERMLTEAQRAAIQAALPEEERTVCVSSSSPS
jgi:hypothetical protein